MSPLTFGLALAGLVGGTYLVRVIGVHLGLALARNGRGADADTEGDSPAQRWLDRATVVLITGVAVTQTLFDGADFGGASRILGVAVGIGARVARLPLLACVGLAMATCAGARWLGWP